MKGPEFLKFCIPIVEVLKELGDSGTPSEVSERVIKKLNIGEKEQGEILKNGQSKVKNKIAWARFYLVKEGLLLSSQQGIWTLSEPGKNVKLDEPYIEAMFKKIHALFQKDPIRKPSLKSEDRVNQEEEDFDEKQGNGYRDDLLKLVRSFSPNGFERLCQLLLREYGFSEVVVTGRSGDGGIDGHGILQVNSLINFKVLFQCKKYQGSVTPAQVRDFRGAMDGRTDKGIILTTGTFTIEAKNEARRDGVGRIELVDGDKLVEMFEKLELGLKPKRTYEIDFSFFSQFK